MAWASASEGSAAMAMHTSTTMRIRGATASHEVIPLWLFCSNNVTGIPLSVHFSPVLLALAFATLVVAVTAFARRLPIPPPILQVVAGFLVGLVPGVAIPQLDPDLVFFVFLPPIIWAAAFFTSLRDFSANRRPITLLAIGLVLVTSAAVAMAARALFPGMTWPVAITLGAIVSPPDAVAATAIISRLPVPRRVIVVLEGESLVNDASALILYRSSVAAAVAGVVQLGRVDRALLRRRRRSACWSASSSRGSLSARCVGRRTQWPRHCSHSPAPYVAWLSAESLHVSAVLACVAGGLFLRRHFSGAVSPLSRLQNQSIWDLLIFVLNAAIFLLLGVQFRELTAGYTGGDDGSLLRAGAIIGLVAIVVRLVWVPIMAYRATRAEPTPSPCRSHAAVEDAVPRRVDEHAGHHIDGHGARAPTRCREWCALPVSK